MNFSLDCKGLSVLSTTIAVGMMGTLSLVFAHLSKQQMIIQKKTEIYFELNNISNKILHGLYDGDGCMKTLGLGTEMIDGQNLNSIKDKKGKVVVETNQVYGNQLIRIDSINIANVEITGTSGQLDLQVVFKKLGRAIKGYSKTIQSYPLSVQVDALRRLTQCTYDYGNIIFVASQGVCESVGGIFDPNTQECALDQLALDMQIEACKNLGLTFDNKSKTCIVNNIVKEIQKKSCRSMDGVFKNSTGRCVNIKR